MGNTYTLSVCLNPYSNGMLTWIKEQIEDKQVSFVLILILMECSLGVNSL